MGEFSLIKTAMARLLTGCLLSQSAFIHVDASTNDLHLHLPWVCTQPKLFNQSKQEAKQNPFLTDLWCCVMFKIPWSKAYKFSFSNDECLHESWAWRRKEQKLRNAIKFSSCYCKVSEANTSRIWITLLRRIIKTDTAGLCFVLLEKSLALSSGGQPLHGDR